MEEWPLVLVLIVARQDLSGQRCSGKTLIWSFSLPWGLYYVASSKIRSDLDYSMLCEVPPTKLASINLKFYEWSQFMARTDLRCNLAGSNLSGVGIGIGNGTWLDLGLLPLLCRAFKVASKSHTSMQIWSFLHSFDSSYADVVNTSICSFIMCQGSSKPTWFVTVAASHDLRPNP